MNRKPITAAERKRVATALAKIVAATAAIEAIVAPRDHRGDMTPAPGFGTAEARALDDLDAAARTFTSFLAAS